MSDSSFDALRDRIEHLLAALTAARARVIQLTQERDDLLARQEEARLRVEAVLQRLRQESAHD